MYQFKKQIRKKLECFKTCVRHFSENISPNLRLFKTNLHTFKYSFNAVADPESVGVGVPGVVTPFIGRSMHLSWDIWLELPRFILGSDAPFQKWLDPPLQRNIMIYISSILKLIIIKLYARSYKIYDIINLITLI